MTGEARALVGRLRATAERFAGDPAVTFLGAGPEPRTYTYESLFTSAQRIANRLACTDVDRRLPIGILLQSQEQQVLHYLAALLAGAVPAILTPPNRKLHREYYAETIAAVLDRSGFSAVITDFTELARGYPSLAPDSLEPTGEPRSTHDGVPVEAGVSFMQFSSGTTGIKRGVLVTDDAVLAQLGAYASALGLSRDDVMLSWLPLYHDMGFIACLNMPLVHGVHAVMLEPVDWVADPGRFLDAVTRFGATLSWNPNFAYAFMGRRVADNRLDGLDLSSLRGLVNCSEPVTHESQEVFAARFRSRGLREDVFHGCYAMAETVFALTHGTPHDPGYLDHQGPEGDAHREGSRPWVSVGSPLPGVDLRVVGDDGAEVGERHVGELWVRSPFNLTGYYRNPEATEAAFHGEWYRTGDLGYRVGDQYYVVGRRKDVLIVSGVNVFPQDVEDLAGSVDGVKPGRVSAFAEFDARQQTERIVVLAESELEGEQAREALMAIRQRVQSGLQVTGLNVHLVPPGWLVKSSAGKMARGTNRRKWQQEQVV